MPRRGSASSSGLRIWPYATTTPTSGASPRRRSTKSGSLSRAGWSTGTSSASAAVFTGGGTAVERERSEEHTSELQSRLHLVCRLLLEKKKKKMEGELVVSEYVV